jgi:hypothetical protein
MIIQYYTKEHTGTCQIFIGTDTGGRPIYREICYIYFTYVPYMTRTIDYEN